MFAICLDGLAEDEIVNHILAAIRSRLTNEPDEERVVAAEELRRLAKGRLLTRLRGACATGQKQPAPGK
jgi:2-oxo-4-hydroxy-4-carboxy--5-ureidoimidazoline (OHCU) decarboxylase